MIIGCGMECVKIFKERNDEIVRVWSVKECGGMV